VNGKAALAALLCVALEAGAQAPQKVHRIALLGVASPVTYQRQVDAFRAGLRGLGYEEGRNVSIDARWAEGDAARLPQLAAELVATSPDVIVTSGPGAPAAKRATSTIPIVMAAAGDAVATGLVQSLSRPGGNLTGLSFQFPEINAKRLAILKDAMPSLARVGVVVNPQGNAIEASLAAMRETSRVLGLDLRVAEARSAADVEAAMDDLVRSGTRAVVVADHTIFVANAARIAKAAADRKLPSIGFLELAESGGTLAYGVDFPELWRQAAGYVDNILKGVPPASLPVQQPTRFNLVVNMKSARAIGLAMPRTLVERADAVLQ
jgi:putative ABC transport system substrate-binding protein